MKHANKTMHFFMSSETDLLQHKLKWEQNMAKKTGALLFTLQDLPTEVLVDVLQSHESASDKLKYR